MEGLTAVPQPIALTDALLMKLIEQGVATVCVVGLLFILYALVKLHFRYHDKLIDYFSNRDALEHRRRSDEDAGENLPDNLVKK